ncbi:hypothetical protein Salat_0873700 [Sesamum alatum]|uniref:Myb/SANT-like domain-containing protein n=1 Tax=Sesamum alatum TaxID=300844 RepID=A0AAE1YJU4_9LAMI|nr:hypothetical protein Salat_0873700 [Sesamum alatum]
MGGSVQDGGVISDEALQRATEQVNLVLKESFTENQNRPRVQKPRERYETFRYLISCPEVYWDRWDNTMTAPSAFWERMTLANPLAKAYEHFGDPNWTALLAIFGPPCLSDTLYASSSSHVNDNGVIKIVDDNGIVKVDEVL